MIINLIFKGGDILALEAINKIQQAEATAHNIIEKAVEDSKIILSDAQIKANTEYEKIIDEAMLKAKKMKDDALIQGEEDSKPTIIKGEQEMNQILNTSQPKVDLAVNLVIERIVKFDGNS